MKLRKSSLLAIAALFAARAIAQTDDASTATAPAAPAATPAPASTTPVNLEATDTARFLAGIQPSTGSPLAELAKDPAWQQHAKFFDAAWATLEKNQLAKIREWDKTWIPAASTSDAPAFYMFSGPDYLYVDAFYPNASTYILCGIEPVGAIPDVSKVKPGILAAELRSLESSLNSVLSFSFFITKDMKNDLQNHDLNGTLPLIYIFLARSDKVIHEVSRVGIDSDGKLQDPSTPSKVPLIPGIKITFSKPDASEPQTLYYFSTDISDDGIKKNGGFLKFCQDLAPGNSFVKSASYLMHESYFSTIRNFLLTSSLTLLEDDSGIPVSYFGADKWQVRYFGAYPGPIKIFAKYMQPTLYSIYQKSHPAALDFGIGYRHYASQSTLILATRKLAKSQETPQAAPAVTPAPVATPVPEATPMPVATPAAQQTSSKAPESSDNAPTITPLSPAAAAQ